MTDEEYMAECKKRALALLPDVPNAIASMGSDLSKRPAYRGVADKMMPVGMFYAIHGDSEGARRWIEGFRP